jgi:hypothetical protein
MVATGIGLVQLQGFATEVTLFVFPITLAKLGSVFTT